jgi:hypothetical protein
MEMAAGLDAAGLSVCAVQGFGMWRRSKTRLLALQKCLRAGTWTTFQEVEVAQKTNFGKRISVQKLNFD